MKNLTQYLHFSEISSEKTSKLTAGDTVKDSINFVGHPVCIGFSLRFHLHSLFKKKVKQKEKQHGRTSFGK